MSNDAKTVGFYDRAAGDYADKFARQKPGADLTAFMKLVRTGGTVLDLGCGPGNAAAMLQDAGFVVEATDASISMVELAKERFGLDARHESFADLNAQNAYDGVWANFSLLHAPREEFPDHLEKIARALKPGGVLHLGMKTGSGQGRDRLDRFYSYYSEEELRNALSEVGLNVTYVRHGTESGMAGTVEPFVILRANA